MTAPNPPMQGISSATLAWGETRSLSFSPVIQQWYDEHPEFLSDVSYCDGSLIAVDIMAQSLTLFQTFAAIKTYSVSTSRNGAGNRENSFCTPLGMHAIAEKIGAGCAHGEIFIAREPQGACFQPDDSVCEKDVITSRILWLRGLQQDYNAGGQCDSYSRYIYIHGTADETRIGEPASIGCVRMKNADVIELFELVGEDQRVLIYQ